MRSASACARARTAAVSASRWLTKPSCTKRSTGYRSPVSTISITSGCGSIHSSGTAQGLPRPTLASVMPTCVPARPTRRSAFKASSMPPAIRLPVIAATMGLHTWRMRWWKGSRIRLRMSTPRSAFSCAASRRSSPAQKVPQSAASSTTTCTASSRSTCSHSACSRLAAATDKALRCCGRFSVMCAMPSCTCSSTTSPSSRAASEAMVSAIPWPSRVTWRASGACRPASGPRRRPCRAGSPAPRGGAARRRSRRAWPAPRLRPPRRC
jgi:hypothetical protein